MRRTIPLFLTFLLAACGGGGGSDGGGNSLPPANQAPIANAGNDQMVVGGESVILAGSGSDTDGTIASYTWTQTAGSTVAITNGDTAAASFDAPNAAESLTFTLVVTDDDGASSSDSVTITVSLAPDADMDGVADFQDNCPARANADQYDVDQDTIGDVCDPTYDSAFPPPVVAPQFGDQTVLFGHFTFSDEPNSPFNLTQTQEFVETGDPISMVRYFRQISYGASTLLPTYSPVQPLPQTRAYYQQNDPSGRTQLIPDALDLLDGQLGNSNYDIVVLMVPSYDSGLGGLGCTAFAGPVSNFHGYSGKFAWLAGPNANSNGCYNFPLMRHELSHTYGFLHSGSIRCGTWLEDTPISLVDPIYLDQGNCGGLFPEPTWFVTSDLYDALGSHRGQVNAYWKVRAGWITPAQVVDVTVSQSVAIDELEKASNGTKAVRIPLGTDQDEQEMAYWVEYRTQPIMLDDNTLIRLSEQLQIRVNIPKALDNFDQFQIGNTVYFDDVGIGKGQMQLALPGDTFSDPYRGISVRRTQNDDTDTIRKATAEIEISGIELLPDLAEGLNESDMLDVTFSNTSTQVVTITNVSLIGRDPSAFSIVNDGCNGQDIGVSGSCMVTVQAGTSTPRDQHANLIFENTDALRPMATLSLVLNNF